jgi:carbonic anhydrase
MSIIEETLTASENYAKNFNLGDLPMPPARKLAVLACMDARLMVDQVLGLKTGDAHVIRNAGGIATEDALRSFVISHHLLGTQEFMIINHTDCGMLTFKDDELRERLEKETGTVSDVPVSFHAFSDVEANVRRQIETVRSHPWIPKEIPVRGFIYDVKSGKLNEVSVGRQSAASRP